MIFQTKKFSAAWDTWMYYWNGVFYLYYLITESSPGEGVGCAVSTDGVHFVDKGQVIKASDKMEFYLGTGSVWRAPGLEQSSLFFCNYSEWRRVEGRLRQTIFFAQSDDLIHWEKLGDAQPFLPDTRWYREYLDEGARWDCVFPLQRQDGSYWGYWTAAPLDGPGVGFGESEDGITWKALPPPQIHLGSFSSEKEVEAGAACAHGGKYYLLVGCYGHPDGVGIFVSDSPQGPFYPQEKGFAVFSNRSHVNGYFPRFLQYGEELLVNFHQLERRKNGKERFYTALAPLKAVEFEEGLLCLKWWKQNDCLLGDPLSRMESNCVITGSLLPGGTWVLPLEGGGSLQICRLKEGVFQYKRDDGTVEERIQRELIPESQGQAQLLIGDTLTELYVGGYYVTCYTLRKTVKPAEIPEGLFCFRLKRDV